MSIAGLIRRSLLKSLTFPQYAAVGLHDPQNLVKDRAGIAKLARIRGPVRPINIVEPVLWLSERISQSRAEA